MAYMGFDALKGKLAGKPGVKNPGGLAAKIGRDKYGKGKFQKAAAEGESMEGMMPEGMSKQKMPMKMMKRKKKVTAGEQLAALRGK